MDFANCKGKKPYGKDPAASDGGQVNLDPRRKASQGEARSRLNNTERQR